MRRVDGQRRQRAEGQEIGLAVPRDDGEVVPGRRGDVGEIREVVAQVQRPDARVEDLLDGGDHVLAAERRAVVPDDAAAQMEGEGELVGRDFPTRGQRRLELARPLSSAARSQPRRSAPASYVLCKKARSISSGRAAVLTASYGRMNSRSSRW